MLMEDPARILTENEGLGAKTTWGMGGSRKEREGHRCWGNNYKKEAVAPPKNIAVPRGGCRLNLRSFPRENNTDGELN